MPSQQVQAHLGGKKKIQIKSKGVWTLQRLGIGMGQNLEPWSDP